MNSAESKHQRRVEQILEQLNIFSSNYRTEHLAKSAALVENLTENEEKPKLAHSRHKTYQKNKLSKAAQTARLARSSLLKIRGGLTPICNTVNTPTFIESLFNQKHQQDYGRLYPLMKLLVAQHLLHSQQGDSLTSYPFTFLLPEDLHGVSVSALSKKIQHKLNPVLKNNAPMWVTAEYFGNGYRKLDKRVTHLNGEMLISPSDLPAVKRAFVQIFRSAEKRKRNQAQLTGGTISTNPVPSYVIIKFPIQSRNLNTHLYGEIYSTLNWASYSFKQDEERALDNRRTRFDCQLQKVPIPAPIKEKFYYISAELNKLSIQFYNENIKR